MGHGRSTLHPGPGSKPSGHEALAPGAANVCNADVARRRSKKIMASPAAIAVLAVIWFFVTYPLAGVALLALAAAAGGAWYSGQQREARARQARQLGYGLDDLDQLSGTDFEAWVTAVIESGGMAAENIRDRGDFGVDVIAEVDGVRVGIQVKRSASSVGNSAVQEALAGSGYHDCSLAGVVTQSSFTPAARKQAERARVPVLLVDREGIHDLARRVRQFASAEGPG